MALSGYSESEPVEPYVVTTIAASSEPLTSPGFPQSSPTSDTTVKSFSPIPPPAILRQQRPSQSPPQNSSSDVAYYTVPNAEQENEVCSNDSRHSRDIPYPSEYEASVETTGEERDEEEGGDDAEVLAFTTAVVKSVMDLNNKLPLAKPNEYIDLVKVLCTYIDSLIVCIEHGVFIGCRCGIKTAAGKSRPCVGHTSRAHTPGGEMNI